MSSDIERVNTDNEYIESSVVEEFRGSWIATSFNIDWPSRSGLSIDNQKQEYISRVDELKAIGMNSVVFQIRPMGDAFYPSNYAPWSKYITGTLGSYPGYDPLSFALDYVHGKNMEFHGWFNPFRISTDPSFNKTDYINKLPVNSLLKSHPEWIVNYEGYHWLNLAIPEVRSYVIDIIMEVVTKYNIDGVHLDDYYYPYPRNNVEFPDQKEFELYGVGYSSKADWRRDNVNKFISEVSYKIRNTKWSVKFGVSPFGIWKNGVSEGGSDTNGLSSYDVLYCDSIKWVNMEWIDYIVPQIYWNIGFGPAAYEKLIQWWAGKVQGKNVHLYIGEAAYKVGNGSTYDEAWDNPEEMPNHIKLSRTYPSIKGNCFFSTKDILENPLGLKDRLSTDLYSQIANVPYMSWKEIASPFTVKYQAHVQNIGWQNEVFNWMLAGTVGQSLRLEGIKIRLENAPEGISIKYRAHVQDIGWQNWVYDGAMAGTEGKSLRLETLQIILEGADSNKYSVQYQAHVQDIGWQNVVRDGAVAGTTGQSRRLEAIRIRIIRKVSVEYQAYVQDTGWQNWVKDGAVAGTEGKSLRLETIKIKLENAPEGLNIKYRAHVQDIGWQEWVYNGAVAGTEGKSLRLEALQIILEGTNADKYSIEYQAHVQDIGWQSWVRDGEVAGTAGQSRRLEAIRIQVVVK